MAWAFVQGVKNENLLPIVVGITATLGNVIVVFAFTVDASSTLTISDTQGNTWTAAAATVQAAGTSARMWWAVAKNSLATTITIGGAGSNGTIVVAEYSGNATASAGDGGTGRAATNSGAADNISTGNVLTTVAGDLIVGGVINTNSLTNLPAGTGETNRATASFSSSSFGIILLEDKVQGAAGNVASTWTLGSNSDSYIAFEVAIKPLGGGSTTPQSVADTVSLTETRRAQAGKVLADALAFTEGRTAQARRTILETVVLTEGLIRFVTHPLADTLALSENLAATKIVLKGVADSMSLTEQLQRAVAVSRVETVSLTEALRRSSTHALIETLQLTESLARQTGHSMAETVSLVENLGALKVLVRALGDTVLLTENLQRVVLKTAGLADTVSLAEAKTLRAGKLLTDTVALTENLATALSGQPTLAVADTLALSEHVTMLVRRNAADTVSLTELRQAQARKTLTELVAFTEALVESILRSKALADTVTLTETLRRQAGTALTEALGLTEARLVAVSVRRSDTLNLGETFAALLIPLGGFVVLIRATAETVRTPTPQSETFTVPQPTAEAWGVPAATVEAFAASL